MLKTKSSNMSMLNTVYTSTNNLIRRQEIPLNDEKVTQEEELNDSCQVKESKSLLLSSLSSTSTSSSSSSSNSSSLSSAATSSSLSPEIKLEHTSAHSTSVINASNIPNERQISHPVINDIRNSSISISSSSSGASCASDSSVAADLSIISFSSTSSLTSSISFDEFVPKNNNNETSLKQNLSSCKTSPVKQQTNLADAQVTSCDISRLLAPYYMKPFYGKEWFYTKLVEYLDRTKSDHVSRCLVLLGDSGTGKSHLSCELKWPIASNLEGLKILNKQIITVYFFDSLNPVQNNLDQFYAHLSRSLQDFSSNINFKENIKLTIEQFTKNSTHCNNDLSNLKNFENYFDKICRQFIEDILNPLKEKQIHDKNYFILIDGLDDALAQSQRVQTKLSKHLFANKEFSSFQTSFSSAEIILMFLNKIFLYFPSWLHLIVTSKRCFEKRYLRLYLTNIKYEKLSMDKCVDANLIISSANQMTKSASKSDNASIYNMTSNTNLISKTDNTEIKKDETNNQIDSLHSLNQLTSINLKSVNRQSTPIEICNAAHFANLKDIQAYILNRLDNDSLLKSKFIKQNNSIDMLNLLLIKSNFCLLYVEKVFDLIINEIIEQSEIFKIPGTLHGLYLYIMQHTLKHLKTDASNNNNTNQKHNPVKDELFYAILGIALISLKPFGKTGIFKRLKTRYVALDFVYFELVFDYITPILFKPLCNTKDSVKKEHLEKNLEGNESNSKIEQTKFIMFHASFIEWLTDVKFCTQKYLCNLDDAHFCLTFYYFNKLTMLKKENENLKQTSISKTKYWNKFKYHLTQAANVLSDEELNYYYLLCESEYNHKILLNTLDRKLLQCKKILKIDNDFHDSEQNKSDQLQVELSNQTKMDYEAIFSMFDLNKPAFDYEKGDKTQINNLLFDLVTRGDLLSTKQLLKNDYKLKLLMNTIFDAYNQTTLLIAVKLNNYEFADFLIRLKHIKLDHCDNSGWTALRYSAWIGNHKIVKLLLDKGASVDAADLEGRTALRAAVFSGHEHIVKLLFEHGADVNKCDLESRSILHVAVYMGHMNIVNYLLQHGAYVNHQDLLGRNILATSIFMSSSNQSNQLEIIRSLIRYGANLDQTDVNNQTPLILAAKENSLRIVEIMIRSGADIDAIDNESYTSLTYAIKNDFADMFELLLKNNAATHVLDKEGRSILSIACSLGSERIVSLLMEKGLDEMHRDNFGWTPLHESTFAGHIKLVEMLLDYGSEIDACDNEGKTSLFYACQEGNYELVKLLFQRNANVNSKSHEGITPFRMACLQNHKKICQYLVAGNVEINYKDPDGRTTLNCLIRKNKNNDMIKLLLDNGASMSIKDSEGRTSLHLASSLGLIDCLKLMLNYNINKNLEDDNGNTFLMTACSYNQLEIVKVLVKTDVNINHQNLDGNTALSISSQNGNYDIVNELLKHGAQIYASSRNPIKLAHYGGFKEVVTLLQEWATACYTPIHAVPRNSKSVDSLKNKLQLSEKLAVTPNSITSFEMLDNQYRKHNSYYIPSSKSMSVSTKLYDNSFKNEPSSHPFSNRSFLINLNESCETIGSQSPKLSTRFKIVRDKLMRKSAFIDRKSNIFSSTNLPQIESPTGKTINSFKNFISSLNGTNSSNKRLSTVEYTSDCLSTNVLTSSPPAASSFTLSSSSSPTKTKNNSFMKILRRKLSFFKTSSNNSTLINSNYRHSHYEIEKKNLDDLVSKQLPRSVTDSKGFKLNNTSNNSTITNNTLTNRGTMITVTDDDVAHIFNRNSLNDCLNPKRSFKECNNLKRFDLNNNIDYCINENTEEPNRNVPLKRPSCLSLNYFKKETSI